MPAVIVDRLPGALVVLKPAGLASELPRDPRADSMMRRLAQDGASGLRLVHRLDAPACGLMLVATTPEAAAHYAREISARRWHKLYVARLGVPAADAARLAGPHKAYLANDGRRASVVRSGGKPSFLDVLAVTPTADGTAASHVLIRLHTGRFHQIRAMLAHAAAPLDGDTLYGARPGGRPYLEHVALGACVDTTLAWTVWQAPAHADRDTWHPAMAAAVDAAVTTARTAPPPPAPAP